MEKDEGEKTSRNVSLPETSAADIRSRGLLSSKGPLEYDLLPRTSAADIRGKQSVRATFRLTERAIDAMSIVAVHLGIKQKSLFDHLIEDAQALNVIAREIKSYNFRQQTRIQKTYVVSRKTLSSLEHISKAFNAPRDALVEYSILRLLPIIRREQARHQKRKDILNDFTKHLNQGERLLEKARVLLGEDDPVYQRIGTAVSTCMSAHRNIESYIERGKIIEEFFPEA